MGLALKIHDPSTEVSEEAKTRIASAHFNDIFFLVKRIAKGHLDDDDARMIADILYNAEMNRRALNKGLLEKQLIEKGRSAQKARHLSDAIFK